MQTLDIPFGEWAPDRAPYGDGLQMALGVYPVTKGYAPFPSGEVLTGVTSLDSNMIGSFWAIDSSGNAYSFLADAEEIWRLQRTGVGTGTTARVGKTAGYTSATRRDFAKFGDRVISCAAGSAVQYYDMGVSSLFADLPGTPPQAETVAVVRDFVVLGALNGSPSELQWSGFNNSEEWGESLSTQASSQVLQGNSGRIQKIIGGQTGYIFTDNSIWRMTYVGPPAVFRFDEVLKNDGTSAPRSVIEINGLIYYYGQNGFRVFDGASSRPIGADQVDQTFLGVNKFPPTALLPENDEIIAGRIGETAATLDRKRNLIIWSVGLSLGGTNAKRRHYVYSIPLQRWSYLGDLSYSGAGFFEFIDENFDNAIELGAINEDLDAVVLTGDPSGVSIVTNIAPLAGGDVAFVSSVEPLTDGTVPVSPGAQVTVRAYQNLLSDAVSSTTPAYSEYFGADSRSTGKYFAFSVSDPAGFASTEFIGLRVRYRRAGRR